MNTQTSTGFSIALLLLLCALTDAAILNRQSVAQRLKTVTKSNIRRIPFSLVGDSYDDCKKSSDPGEICIFDPSTIHPTQFGLGMDEVACKVGRIESMSSKDLDQYLLDHIAPVIIGPDAFYITDHHHLARAMVDADIDSDKKYMYGQIVYNWHDYPSMEAFWQEMIIAGEVWLYDEKGMQPMDPQYIPATVDLLLNDPFRSLAWMVQNNGGYSKAVGADFQEFLWANYFRANIALPKITEAQNNDSVVPPSTQTKWSWCTVRPYDEQCLPNEQAWLQSVLPQAMGLAAAPQASSLPGYGTGEVDEPNCG